MKKELFVIVFIAIMGGAQGSILDQSQEQIGSSLAVISPEWSIAQTFTAGITGQLETLDLCLDNNIPTGPTLELYPTTFSIVGVIDEAPSGSVLGTIYEEELTKGFNSIDFLPESVFLNAGSQYAIVLYNDDPTPHEGTSTQWRATVDVYSRGAMWAYFSGEWTQTVTPPGGLPDETFYDKDAAFRTYMVPEPTALLLFGFGGLMLRKKRRR